MSTIPRVVFGGTGMEVGKLGYGAMELRGGDRGRTLDDATLGKLLNAVLDAGINFIDTSPDYGLSEERIGEHIATRREEFLLASKCGCPIGRPPPAAGERPQHVFTRQNVRAGVEQSLRRMRTDHLDLVQFHASPARSVLEANESVEELKDLRSEGKIRFLGVSGTLPNLPDQIAMGVFDAFQIPWSALEREHEQSITDAARAGAGTVIRGGVARGIPDATDESIDRLPETWRGFMRQRREKWDRAGLDDLLEGASRMELMLRYTISHPDMHTTIVGTASLEHLAANVAAASKGALPTDVYEEARRRLA